MDMGFVDDVIMTKPEPSKIDVSSFIIDLSEQVPDPQPIVRIWGNLIASRGNISTVVGLAKSRKTFLTRCCGLGIPFFIGFSRVRHSGYWQGGVYWTQNRAGHTCIRSHGAFCAASACRLTATMTKFCRGGFAGTDTRPAQGRYGRNPAGSTSPIY